MTKRFLDRCLHLTLLGTPRLLLLVLLVLAGVGCSTSYPPASGPSVAPGTAVEEPLAVPALSGKVDLGPVRHLMASAVPTTYVNAATVSVIDTGTNATITTTTTNTDGSFVMDFPDAFTPANGTTYYVEAIKGAGSNLPGNEAIRVRTIVQYSTSPTVGWKSVTNAAVGSITVDQGTTAIAIAAAARAGGANAVTFASLMGAYVTSTGVYTAVTNLTVAEFNTLVASVGTAIAAGQDPVARIGVSSANAVTTFPNTYPAIYGVDKPMCAEGDTLTLDGRFYPGALVTFPGGGIAELSSVVTFNNAGLGRGTVTVPTGASPGTLTLSSRHGSTTLAGFRPLRFTPSLGRFDAEESQGAFARALPNLSTARYGHTSVSYGGYLYAVGGFSTVYLNTVERATIGSDGSLGPFSAVTPGTSFTARRYHASVVLGGALYVIGGQTGTGVYSSSVQRAAIASDGSLGAFATLSSLTAVRAGHTAAVIGNYLYVVGGTTNGTTYVNSIERALINADGTLGTFAVVTPTTSFAIRAFHTSAVVGNKLFVAGGTNATAALSSVESATIATDGSVGSFAVVTPGTPMTARIGHTMAVLPGASSGASLVVAGGATFAGAAMATPEVAPLSASGVVSNFAAVALPGALTARQYPSSLVVGNFLYVLGGLNSTAVATVERAAINAGVASTTFGTFAAAAPTTSFTARQAFASAVSGSTLYVAGGINGTTLSNSVEKATINADGSLGNFSSAGTFTTARSDHTLAVSGGYLYVIGGQAPVGTPLSAVERAQINADGTLGAFSTVTPATTFPARWGHASFVYAGSLYVVGGCKGPTAASDLLDDVYYAPLTAGGGLGSFAETTKKSALTSARRYHASAVIGSALYLIGGEVKAASTTAVTATTEVLTLGATGDIAASGVAGPALVAARRRPTSFVVGSALHVLGGSNSLAPAAANLLASIERLTPTVASGLPGTGTFATVPATGAFTARDGHTDLVIGNYLYVMGGSNGTAATSTIDRVELR